MKYDLTNMKAVLQNDKYAVYVISKIDKTHFKGIRLDKEKNKIVEVLIEKNPAYRVIGFQH